MSELTTTDLVDVFTLELLRSGCALSELAVCLIDDLPDNAYPGEKTEDVVVEMIVGSIRTYLFDATDAEVARAAELIAGASARVIEHLRLALEIRGREDALRHRAEKDA